MIYRTRTDRLRTKLINLNQIIESKLNLKYIFAKWAIKFSFVKCHIPIKKNVLVGSRFTLCSKYIYMYFGLFKKNSYVKTICNIAVFCSKSS